MFLPKLLTGALAVLPLVPLAPVAAQTAGPSNDSGSRPTIVWVSALGAASAGAALFAAFSRSSQPAVTPHGASGIVKTDPIPPASPPVVPGVSGNSEPTGNTTVPPKNDPPNDPPPTVPLTPVSLFVPQGPLSPPPEQPTNQNLVVTDVSNVATVPEPGALGLLATGIVGLIPLTRRRNRR